MWRGKIGLNLVRTGYHPVCCVKPWDRSAKSVVWSGSRVTSGTVIKLHGSGNRGGITENLCKAHLLTKTQVLRTTVSWRELDQHPGKEGGTLFDPVPSRRRLTRSGKGVGKQGMAEGATDSVPGRPTFLFITQLLSSEWASLTKAWFIS